DRLLACGTPYTGAFQVPAVAWLLHQHTTVVRSASAPGDAPPQVPAIVFRSKTTSTSHAVPPIDNIGGEPAGKTVAHPGRPAVGGSWGGAGDGQPGRARAATRAARPPRHRAPRRQPAEVDHGAGLPGRRLARAAQPGDPRALLDRRGPIGRDLLAPAPAHPWR